MSCFLSACKCIWLYLLKIMALHTLSLSFFLLPNFLSDSSTPICFLTLSGTCRVFLPALFPVFLLPVLAPRFAFRESICMSFSAHVAPEGPTQLYSQHISPQSSALHYHSDWLRNSCVTYVEPISDSPGTLLELLGRKDFVSGNVDLLKYRFRAAGDNFTSTKGNEIGIHLGGRAGGWGVRT